MRQGLLRGLGLYFAKLRLFSRNARMVLIYSGLTGLVFGVYRLLFNFYVLSLGGYDERFLGNLTSYSSLAALLAALPAVYLSDRFSQKQIMIVTGLVSTVSLVGLVVFPLRPLLITFTMIIGLSQAVRQVAVSPFLMANTNPEERQYVFSFNFGLMTLASAAGSQLGGSLPTWFGGLANVMPTSTLAYQLTIGAMGIVSLIALSPLPFITMARLAKDRVIEMPWKKLARHGSQMFRLITPQIIIGLGAGMMMPFMNLYYRNVFGLGDATIGTIFAAAVFGMAIAQFLAPPLADRMGKINVVMLTQALSIPFLIMLGLAAWFVPGGQVSVGLWLGITAVAYFLRMALMNLSGPIYETFILEQAKPEAQSLASALNGLSFQFGWVVSPSISGWFQAEYGDFGFVPVFASVSVLYATAIFTEWLFFRNIRKVAHLTPEPTEDFGEEFEKVTELDDIRQAVTK
jgi:MFS family permease